MDADHCRGLGKPYCPKCKKSINVTRTVGRWFCTRCNHLFPQRELEWSTLLGDKER